MRPTHCALAFLEGFEWPISSKPCKKTVVANGKLILPSNGLGSSSYC